MDAAKTFRLAPMTAELRILTWVLFVLPVVFVYFGFTAPPPVGQGLLGTGAFVVLTYASVWFFFRPTRFELGRTLRIVWPVRTRDVPWRDVEDARIISAADFRREYGFGMRVGAGGLWGGFGLLKTGRETFSMWISRTDRFVIVRVRNARPLLVTPEDPERFVDDINARKA